MSKNASNGLLLLSREDNVFVAMGSLNAETTYQAGKESIEMKDQVILGHKVARMDIADGDRIIKYGACIGSATISIAKGEHVHLHNMRSNYTGTLLPGAIKKVELCKDL